MPDIEPTRLLREALVVPFRGWDFTALGERIRLEPPPWPFEEMVDHEAQRHRSMLDLGTGGGEWLGRRHHCPRTVATESWPPNVVVAAARLRALGIPIVHSEGAVDNVDQEAGGARGQLPFRTSTFELVVSRHEAFAAHEIARVLRPDGVFLTQQADSGTAVFHRLLGLAPPPDHEFRIDLAVDQLEDAGLHVERSGVGSATTTFADIGALAWYLTNVPWAVPGFSIERHRDALLALHGRPIPVASDRFWVRAVA